MITVKSVRELDIMKAAGEIAAYVQNKIEKAVKPGVMTKELDRIAEEIIKSRNAVPSFRGYPGHSGAPDFPASICASVNNEVIHGIPGLRELKSGDIISIDVGVYLNGFHADMARTYSVGIVSGEAMKLIKTTEECFYKGMEKAVNGNRIIDISGAIQDHARQNGFTTVRDFVGHGIGKEMHEAPQIPNYRSRERGPRLLPGMTLAIEPMLNTGAYDVHLLGNKWTVVTKDGSLSAHYENTVVVTENEAVILTI